MHNTMYINGEWTDHPWSHQPANVQPTCWPPFSGDLGLYILPGNRPHTITLPPCTALPTASEIPRTVPYLHRRWLRTASPVVADLQAGPPTESYMAHNYTGQLAIPVSVDWSNKCWVITPRNRPRNSATAAAGWRPWSDGMSRPLSLYRRLSTQRVLVWPWYVAGSAEFDYRLITG